VTIVLGGASIGTTTCRPACYARDPDPSTPDVAVDGAGQCHEENHNGSLSGAPEEAGLACVCARHGVPSASHPRASSRGDAIRSRRPEGRRLAQPAMKVRQRF
jgi:hypothetical protein